MGSSPRKGTVQKRDIPVLFWSEDLEKDRKDGWDGQQKAQGEEALEA